MGLVASIYYIEGLVQLGGVPMVAFGDRGWYLTRNTLPPFGLGCTALLVFSAGVARAEVPQLIPAGKFESEGAFGIAVDNSCYFKGLSGSACATADSSDGDVYVAGFLHFPKKKEGESLGPVKHDNKFNGAGSLLSPFGEEGAYAGVAVNPTNGDVYVLTAGSEIDTYDPSTGALLLPSFPVPASGNFALGATAVQIATDSAGDIYVPVVPDKEVLEYPPTGEPREPIHTFTGGPGVGALREPTGVAVDSSGNVWVADAGHNRIEELSPADAPIAEIDSTGVQAIALDAHGDVFAIDDNSADPCVSFESPCDHLVEYGPTGAQLADLGAGEFGVAANQGFPFSFSMPAVNESTGRVYVTDGGKDFVWMFMSPHAPALESELAVEVGASEAKLGALVNPGGLEMAYRFEYLTEAAFQANGESFSGPEVPVNVPFPEGDAGQGFSSHTVWAAAKGLAPDTTYHYRAVVASGLGHVVGADQTFTTVTAAQVSCPNEQRRTAFSASLPDCRAYELVTPPNITSATADPTSFPAPGDEVGEREHDLTSNFAADNGERLSFIAKDIFPGSRGGGQYYLATRSASKWEVENEIPPTNYYGYKCAETNESVLTYSSDLSKAILAIGGNPECGGPEPVLVKGEPQGAQNLYVRDNTDGTYELVNPPPLSGITANATLDGASTDLSHVCFSEHAQLTPDALAGVENEYEWVDGVVHLVTAGAPAQCDSPSGVSAATLPAGYEPVRQVSVNGFIAFESLKRLTGYDNTDANTGAPDPEIYLYDIATGSLSCVSCNPSGAAPTGGAAIEARPSHPLSENGRVFFDTAEGLLPADSNEQVDVYEFEPDGVGSCHVAAGCLFPVSTGTGSGATWFIDASANGDDVFLREYQKLVPQDTQEEAATIYDARVDGGFPEPAAPSSCATATTAEECRAAPAPAPSIFGAPASQTFSGIGNLAAPIVASKKATKKKLAKCKKGFVRKKSKCVRVKKSKKAKKKISRRGRR